MGKESSKEDRVPAGGGGAGRGMSGPRGATEQDHEIPRRRVTAGDI
jgi:hypothetical protein